MSSNQSHRDLATIETVDTKWVAFHQETNFVIILFQNTSVCKNIIQIAQTSNIPRGMNSFPNQINLSLYPTKTNTRVYGASNENTRISGFYIIFSFYAVNQIHRVAWLMCTVRSVLCTFAISWTATNDSSIATTGNHQQNIHET